MGGNSSVKELLVQGHAKVVGNGTQVIVGDGLPDDAAAHGENLDVALSTLLDGVGNRLPQKSSRVNVNLSGQGPSILLRKTVLSLKSPTGAFIAPLRCANANF